MVDPQDIERMKFGTTRIKEGYDQDEVDNYLDRVADTIRQLNTANANLAEENSRLKRRLAPHESAPTMQLPLPMESEPERASKLLALAQRTADEVVAEAKRQGDAIRHDATQEADTRRRQAEAEAFAAERDLESIRSMRQEARTQLEAILKEVHAKLGDDDGTS